MNDNQRPNITLYKLAPPPRMSSGKCDMKYAFMLYAF